MTTDGGTYLENKSLTSKMHKNVNNLIKRTTTAFLSSQNVNSTIITDKIDQIVTIGINRPQKRNCINLETAKLLTKAIEDFENDDSLLVAVLHGIGGNFCSGYDLKELATCENTQNLFTNSGNMGPTQRQIKKPLIAGISGYAVAGGLELALMCDLRVVEDTAIMGIYNRRFGIPLIDGGTVRLTSIVGLSRALDLILTGRSLEAKEAFQWGIANRIVACGTALGQAINLAISLTKFPQKCLLQDRKSTYNAAYNMSFSQLLEYEKTNGVQVIDKETVKGAQKFLSGVGRHGKTYNLTERNVAYWEKE